MHITKLLQRVKLSYHFTIYSRLNQYKYIVMKFFSLNVTYFVKQGREVHLFGMKNLRSGQSILEQMMMNTSSFSVSWTRTLSLLMISSATPRKSSYTYSQLKTMCLVTGSNRSDSLIYVYQCSQVLLFVYLISNDSLRTFTHIKLHSHAS